MNWEREMEVARRVARGAGEIALEYAARGVEAEDKPDHSPVTAADREKSRAALCLTGFNAVLGRPFAPRLLDFMAGFWSVRSLGGCQDAMLVASGRADCWIEIGASAWDLAPLKVIAEEAGARFFNFDGGNSIHGGNAVICVPPLEAELRAFVSEP